MIKSKQLQTIVSISSILIAAPALTYAEESDLMCDNETLGVSQNSVEAEAIWEPIVYKCAKGSYLDTSGSDIECRICPAGYYCGNGGEYTTESPSTLAACPQGYTSVPGGGDKTTVFSSFQPLVA